MVDSQIEKARMAALDIQTIFVIGLPRSGTTLLASLLGGEECVLSLSEPFLSRAICRHRLLNGIYFPKIRKCRITPPENTDEMGFLAYLKRFSRDLGFSDLIIKETYRIPPYYENSKLLGQIAESGEKVVAIMRHPYDTAVSTIRLFRQWGSATGRLMRIVVPGLPGITEDRKIVEWVAQNWVSFNQWFRQNGHYMVSYENLVRNPTYHLKEISEHCHIPFGYRTAGNENLRSIYGVCGDEKVLSKCKKSLMVRPVGKSNQLKSELADIIKRICGQAAEELGYTL